MVSNIKEVKSRGAVVLSVAQEGNTDIENVSDHVLYIPRTLDILAPVLTVVPLQLLHTTQQSREAAMLTSQGTWQRV